MVNKVILIGNLGRDPEISYTPSGVAVCKVSLATTERFTTRDGEKREKTEWHNLVFWRRQAEVANEYLRKGSKIYVEGRISYRSWEGNDGTKRYATDIEVQNFQMLSGRGEVSKDGESRGGSTGEKRSSGGDTRTSSQTKPATEEKEGIHYEEIPQPGASGDSFGKSDDDLPF